MEKQNADLDRTHALDMENCCHAELNRLYRWAELERYRDSLADIEASLDAVVRQEESEILHRYPAHLTSQGAAELMTDVSKACPGSTPHREMAAQVCAARAPLTLEGCVPSHEQIKLLEREVEMLRQRNSLGSDGLRDVSLYLDHHQSNALDPSKITSDQALANYSYLSAPSLRKVCEQKILSPQHQQAWLSQGGQWSTNCFYATMGSPPTGQSQQQWVSSGRIGCNLSDMDIEHRRRSR